ncbi:MAG TPA: DUF5676 family membrane protein [Patescibacteria group bacterium]
MKLNQMAVANTFGIVAALYFIGCAILATFAPDIYKTVAQSWFHSVNLSAVWKPSQDGFLVGLVTFTGVSWVTGWLGALIYNSFTRK